MRAGRPLNATQRAVLRRLAATAFGIGEVHGRTATALIGRGLLRLSDNPKRRTIVTPASGRVRKSKSRLYAITASGRRAAK